MSKKNDGAPVAEVDVEKAVIINPHKEADVIPQAVGKWIIVEAVEKFKSSVIDLGKVRESLLNYNIIVQSKGNGVSDEINKGDRINLGAEIALGAFVKDGKLYGTVHEEAVTAILHPIADA